MSRYDPARDCFTTDPPPAPTAPAEEPPAESYRPVSPAPVPQAEPASQTLTSPIPSSPEQQKKPTKSPSSPEQRKGRTSLSPSSSRKRKASAGTSADAANGSKVPLSAANLPKIKRRAHNESKPKEPPKYRYRSPPPSLIPMQREPSPAPPTSRESSPPRKRKRPTGRLTQQEREATRAAVRRREEEEAARAEAFRKERERVVEEVVRSHYNDKKELGKTWRKTDSKIRGLRGFNNWIKSTVIQKFSPSEDFDPHQRYEPLCVLDMGCGKGGDLLKWKSAPQEVALYVGVDTADVSIAHARDRYDSMLREDRRRRSARRTFDAEFHAMDCWTHWVGDIPIVNRVGADPHVGPGAAGRVAARWGGGGFDVVSMMFCMHYAFETEAKCRTMLRNVAGSLKRGGRFVGTIPSSDVISARVQGKDPRDTLPEDKPDKGIQEWGNSIYTVRFTEAPPRSGVFRPPWGWQYNFFLTEAVEEVPEYVVPWEAFRAIAEDYNLELVYKKPFHDVWKEEKEDRELRVLAERMGVVNRDDGKFALGDEEWEACGFYMAFAFKKM